MVSVIAYPKVRGSLVSALVLEGVNYLVQEGLVETDFWLDSTFDHTAFALFDGTEPVSVLVYEHVPFTKTAVLKLAYTEPSSRGKGYFTRLLTEMEERVAVLGLNAVEVSVDTANVKFKQLLAKARSVVLRSETFSYRPRRAK